MSSTVSLLADSSTPVTVVAASVERIVADAAHAAASSSAVTKLLRADAMAAAAGSLVWRRAGRAAAFRLERVVLSVHRC